MLRSLIPIFWLLAGPSVAGTMDLSIGQDRYEVGKAARFEGPAVTDLFMGGSNVAVSAPVAGSAHLVGRRVTVDAAVSGDVFAAGYAVTDSAPVDGDATILAYEIELGPIGGNLRAAGVDVRAGSVGGYALINGEDVSLQGPVAGDAIVAADTIEFGPDARVGGKLTIYAEDPAGISVPETVAPAERVEVKSREHYDAQTWTEQVQPDIRLWRIVAGFLSGVLISGLIAALAIFIAPQAVQNWRALALARPGRAIWSGFLVASALAGSGFVLMLTIVGVILLPVMLIVTAVAIFAGYSLGSYVLGIGLWQALRRPVPDGLPGKFGLACLGAFVAGLAWLVPVAGWFFVLGLTLLGIGTLAAFVLPVGLLLRREA